MMHTKLLIYIIGILETAGFPNRRQHQHMCGHTQLVFLNDSNMICAEEWHWLMSGITIGSWLVAQWLWLRIAENNI